MLGAHIGAMVSKPTGKELASVASSKRSLELISVNGTRRESCMLNFIQPRSTGMTITEQIKEQSAEFARRTGEEIRRHPVATAALAVTAVGIISYLATQALRTSHNGRSH